MRRLITNPVLAAIASWWAERQRLHEEFILAIEKKIQQYEEVFGPPHECSGKELPKWNAVSSSQVKYPEVSIEELRERMRKRMADWDRYLCESRQKMTIAEMCIDIVVAHRKDIDPEEFEEWVLNETGACMPVSLGKIFRNNIKIEMI